MIEGGAVSHVIEFRNGSYLANLDADHGVPIGQAMRFASKKEAEDLMRLNQWIDFYGGMAVEAKETK